MLTIWFVDVASFTSWEVVGRDDIAGQPSSRRWQQCHSERLEGQAVVAAGGAGGGGRWWGQAGEVIQQKEKIPIWWLEKRREEEDEQREQRANLGLSEYGARERLRVREKHRPREQG
ncbi:uncharacterized protein CIMG_09097 [Coccidioides immitis RS]|uniref:Uncharacterized protein n=2 Tax=Coccidioides immitis TaxID=5501 RepID=J3K1L8_COCIM|nr:uncharacterized protein CIMG_09097 [Coccidioides immitis RS]EAS27893.3 hypothetical protein CIMG_09097 [Coccidioides immitis RS]KMP08689.1 hypothetical protein CIRG_08369 [Coccidioides immitis RMSCC 2394]